jgi:hypothetical protein
MSEPAVPRDMARIEQMLLWARANKFRVREIHVADVHLVLDDLGATEALSKGAGPAKTPETEQKSVHAAWAQVFGVPFVEDDDDPDDAEGRT